MKKQSGDTIIEVLFAVTVFAMVAVGSLSIMNQGTGTAQRALEITQVRSQIDAQADAIRYIHQSYVDQKNAMPTNTAAQWPLMTSKAVGSKGADIASPFGQLDNGRCPGTVPGQRPFVLNARKAIISTTLPKMTALAGASSPPFAQVVYNDDSVIEDTYGLWIEAIPSPSTNGPGFVDFHIRACWDSPGSSIPVTLGTIVRLYEPR